MVCEKCKRCFNYKVSELGCYGNEKVCKHFQTDDIDEWLVTGVEDGWIEVDKETWKEYLQAKERLGE